MAINMNIVQSRVFQTQISKNCKYFRQEVKRLSTLEQVVPIIH